MDTEHQAVDFRPDGSIAFTIDAEKIRWRPPKVKHMRVARNLQFDITKKVRDLNEHVRTMSSEVKRLVIRSNNTDDEALKADLATQIRDLSDKADQGSRDQLEEMTRLYAEWVTTVHDMLRLEGDLPDSEDGETGDEWPSWLPTIDFVGRCLRHWGAHPFGSSNGSQPVPSETKP